MLPIKTRSIFKNRWIALLWAAGICWTAIDVADSHRKQTPAHDGKPGTAQTSDSGSGDGDGDALSAQDAAAIKQALATMNGK